MTHRLFMLLLFAALPLKAQAPKAGSTALGLGFGVNTAGVLGFELSARYMVADRLAVGCRVSRGWGLERTCGLNVYPSRLRDWHLVAELGNTSIGPHPVQGEPVSERSWFANLGLGVEEKVENGEGGHYRDNRVHFTIGPSFVFASRRSVDGQPTVTRWGVSPRFFTQTELLLYPVVK
jgi:hypothetical protein